MTLLVEQNGSVYEMNEGGGLVHVSGPERDTALPNLPDGYFPDIRAAVAAEPWRVQPWTITKYTVTPDPVSEPMTPAQLRANPPRVY